MANELKYFGLPSQTGLTVTAKVYDSVGVQVGGDISTNEVSSDYIYLGDMPTADSGQYVIRFFNSSTLLGQSLMEWDGEKETTLGDLSGTDIANSVWSNDTRSLTFYPYTGGSGISQETIEEAIKKVLGKGRKDDKKDLSDFKKHFEDNEKAILAIYKEINTITSKVDKVKLEGHGNKISIKSDIKSILTEIKKALSDMKDDIKENNNILNDII